MVRGEWASDKQATCTLLTRALQEHGGSGRLLEQPKAVSFITDDLFLFFCLERQLPDRELLIQAERKSRMR